MKDSFFSEMSGILAKYGKICKFHGNGMYTFEDVEDVEDVILIYKQKCKTLADDLSLYSVDGSITYQSVSYVKAVHDALVLLLEKESK